MKASASSGACGEIMMTVWAPLLMTRAARFAIASIELRTSAIASRPTSGTMIGGCGAIPAKTTELLLVIEINRRGHRELVLVNGNILAPPERLGNFSEQLACSCPDLAALEY